MGWMDTLPVSLGWNNAKNQHIHESIMQTANHSINVIYAIFLQCEFNKSMKLGQVTQAWEKISHVDKLDLSEEHLQPVGQPTRL